MCPSLPHPGHWDKALRRVMPRYFRPVPEDMINIGHARDARKPRRGRHRVSKVLGGAGSRAGRDGAIAVMGAASGRVQGVDAVLCSGKV